MAEQLPIKRQFEAAVDKAMLRLNIYLDQRFTEEISAVKWDYPTPPQVRDIVDTGRLRASQTRVQVSPRETLFSWPTEYAMQVHEGGVSAITGQPFPPRRWTEKPLLEAPKVFTRILAQEIGPS